MCGICGVIGRRVEDHVARKMLDSIAHRGPDDEGILKEDNVFLGHRRLSIIDVSKAGHQPMSYGAYSIVFNGEIYNYIELRLILEQKGHQFVTNTDTEVFLHAYIEWGKKCFPLLRGMWGVCIYDRQANQIVLSRDRFGIKPLYYYTHDGELTFASEIPSLLVAGKEAKPNISRVVAYLMVDINEAETSTFFDGIEQLPAGTVLTFDLITRVSSTCSYYDLAEQIQENDENDYESLYYESIKMHLRSDVKVGVCLSGGLDSSTLAAVAQKTLGDNSACKMTAITAKSEDGRNDESIFAKQVVNKCALNWEISYPRYEDFVAWHKEMLRSQAEPVGGPSIFMQFWVMRAAKNCGIKVMLDGQGGDETLLGYERYYASYLFGLLKNGNIIDFVRSYLLITECSRLSVKELFQYFIYFSFFSVRKRYLSNRMKYVRQDLREEFFKDYRGVLCQTDNVTQLQIDEIMKGHLSALLRYEDRSSMYYSLEARVPYLDNKLVEKAINLRLGDKLFNGWTKYILRRIASDVLPETIAWRKNKYGFEAPEDKWLTRYVEPMQDAVDKSKLLHQILTEIPDLKELPLRVRWRLYNLAVWEEQYLC